MHGIIRVSQDDECIKGFMNERVMGLKIAASLLQKALQTILKKVGS